MKIDKIKVYDWEESLLASGYPMVTKIVDRETTEKDLNRGINLTKASKTNGAHAQWLTGVRVAFDLTCTNKMWVELERYRFMEFVSSQSTMHRITRFELSDQYIHWVDKRIIKIMEEKKERYAVLDDLTTNHRDMYTPAQLKALTEEKTDLYYEMLYSNPAGFELTARLTTNYRCLLNVYNQRHDHRLYEWREFCEKLLDLPHFKELVEVYCGI